MESSRILKKNPSSVDELSGAMIFTKTSMGVENSPFDPWKGGILRMYIDLRNLT